MSQKNDDGRVAVSIRMTPELLERLEHAAHERMVSRNLLCERAINDYLERLIPISELSLTRTQKGEVE